MDRRSNGDTSGGESHAQRAHSEALRFVSYRPRTEAEVRRKLRRTYPSNLVDEVVILLRDEKLIDDSAFASAWAESRHSLKPRSAYAIRRELLTKGVDRNVAEEAVEGLDDDDSAYRAAQSLARRTAPLGLAAFRRRLLGFLRRRGYATSACRRTIDRLWAELEAE